MFRTSFTIPRATRREPVQPPQQKEGQAPAPPQPPLSPDGRKIARALEPSPPSLETLRIEDRAERELRQKGIVIDWRRYYLDFQAAHGEPVIVTHESQQVLLFPDCWVWDKVDYRAQEVPPPDDPLALTKLRELYLRGKIARLEEITAELIEDTAKVNMVAAGRTLPVHARPIKGADGEPVDPLDEARTKLQVYSEELIATKQLLANLRMENV